MNGGLYGTTGSGGGSAPFSELVCDGTLLIPSMTANDTWQPLTPTITTNTVLATLSGTNLLLGKQGRYVLAVLVFDQTQGLGSTQRYGVGIYQNGVQVAASDAAYAPTANFLQTGNGVTGRFTGAVGDVITIQAWSQLSGGGAGNNSQLTGSFSLMFIPTRLHSH